MKDIVCFSKVIQTDFKFNSVQFSSIQFIQFH